MVNSFNRRIFLNNEHPIVTSDNNINTNVVRMFLNWLSFKIYGKDVYNISKETAPSLYWLSYSKFQYDYSVKDCFLFTAAESCIRGFKENNYTRMNTAKNPLEQAIKAKLNRDVRVYYNEDKRNVIVIGDVTEKVIFLILSLAPKFYPDVFKNITVNELAILKTLADDKTEEFKELVDEEAENCNLCGEMLMMKLNNMPKTFINKKINALQSNIENAYSRIADYERMALEVIKSIKDTELTIGALKSSEMEDMSFFTKRKNVIVTEVNEGSAAIKYCVKETLEYFDDVTFEKMFKNNSSTLFNYFPRGVDKSILEDYKNILWNIFSSDAIAKLKVFSEFNLIEFSSLLPVQYGTLYKELGAAGHPHLVYYGCLGGNLNEIAGYLKKGDWQSAIDQSIVATKNLNFSDSTVVGRMCGRLVDYLLNDGHHELTGVKCIILNETKECMTIREFADYLRKQGQETKEEVSE